MLPVIDFSSKLSVSNTAYNTSSRYAYSPPSGKYLLLREVSLTGDSTFLSSGFFQMFIAGAAITSNGSVATEVAPLNAFTLRFGDDDLVFLAPGQQLEIKMRVSSGTGTTQAVMTGILLNEQEYAALMAKKGLVA